MEHAAKQIKVARIYPSQCLITYFCTTLDGAIASSINLFYKAND